MADNKKGKIGVQDIAEILNISASTVSRALNDHPRISRETKDNVWQVAKRLGYFTSMPEFASPNRSEVITILVPTLDFSFYREVIDGVIDYFGKKNYDIFIVDTRNDESNAHNFFGKYNKYGISGVVHVVSNRTIPANFYSRPLEEALPVISVFESEHKTGVSSVLPDMFHGVFNSVKHLYSIGNKDISLFLEHKDCPLDNQIVTSFMSAIESVNGTSDDLSVYYSGKDERDLMQIIKGVLNKGRRPDVIFVKNVFAAFNVELELQREGIKIPDDMMLITIDTISGVKHIASNMSLLKLPAYDMGYKAAEMLMAQIRNPKTDKKVSVIPANFILKGSAMRIG